MAGSGVDAWSAERLGSVVADRYRIERVLGRGATGVVFAGVHTWTDRPVAIKLLHRHAAQDDPTLTERFLREAKAAASLPHPNVVDVLDMGEHEGAPYLVLELLVGEPLDALLGRWGALGVERTIEILAPLLDALHSAHARGMVHRDVKAANIFLHVDDAENEVPKILDFGTVRKNYAAGETPLTRQGDLLGTPHYMSPEQIIGRPVTAKSDVWASGVLAYRMLSARYPFDGPNPTMVLADVATKPHPPLASVAGRLPVGVVDAVELALVKDPEARHADMHAFLDALLEGARAVGMSPADPRDRLSRG